MPNSQPGRIVVVTPWYPTPAKPYQGSFVRQWITAGGHSPGEVTVIHLANVPPGTDCQVTCSHDAAGPVWRVPVPIEENRPRAEVARAQAAALTPELIDLIRQAEVVVGHVIMPSGWAVSGVLAPDQRFVLVEHASYLQRLIENEVTRPMVQATVARAEAVLTAGEGAATMLRLAAPAHRGQIWAVGNPLDLAAWPLAPHRSGPLDHWLYVGNLLAAKGVLRLAGAFTRYARHHPAASLTVVGDGVDRARMAGVLRHAGLAERTHFTGSLDQGEVAGVMAKADVLVHLSAGETFGLAPLEALVSGLPVVASRTQGTDQTMSFALSSGRVALVEQAHGRAFERAVVDAVEELGRGPTANRAAEELRAEVARRYGSEGFGRLLQRVYRGELPYPVVDGLVQPVVALTVREADCLAPAIRELLWRGQKVLLAVGQADLATGQDPRVMTVDLSESAKLPEAARWLGRLVWAGPGLTLMCLTRLAALFGRLPGPLGQFARRVSGRSQGWRTAWNSGHGRRLEAVRFSGRRGANTAKVAADRLASALGVDQGSLPPVMVGRGEPKAFRNALERLWLGGVRQIPSILAKAPGSAGEKM